MGEVNDRMAPGLEITARDVLRETGLTAA